MASALCTVTHRRKQRLRRLRYPVVVCALVFLLRALTLHDAPLLDAGASAIIARAPHSDAAYAARVRAAMARNFDAYWHSCRGADEYEPVLDKCHQWFKLGLTAVDSIDTLVIMRLTKQYELVARWAEYELNIPGNSETVSFFELVIRALGGFNSAFALTGEEVWKSKAKELGDAIIHSFNLTNTGCPPTEVTLNGGYNESLKQELETINPILSTAEAGTMQLEMRTLSRMTGLPHYAKAADLCIDNMVQALPDDRVVPVAYNSNPFTIQESFDTGGKETIGAHVDSFVEMMLKTWIWSGKRDGLLRIAFERQVELIFQELSLVRNGTLALGINHDPSPDEHTPPSPTMEHLACFFPGVLALGALHGLGGGVHGKSEHDYIHRARALTRTCYLMSRSNEHGLAPEISYIQENGTLIPNEEADHSLLRPEVIEAIFVMHHVTGDPIYRGWGKQMWDDIQRSGTLENGLLTSSFQMRTGTLKKYGKLHSFVFAETLKYFFLLFRDKGDGPKVDLENWVFNTEAHPVPILHNNNS